jgi:hypothetical protein
VIDGSRMIPPPSDRVKAISRADAQVRGPPPCASAPPALQSRRQPIVAYARQEQRTNETDHRHHVQPD